MSEQSQILQRLRVSVILPLTFLALLWLIEIVQTFGHLRLVSLGILPREPEGLVGVVTGPMIHGDFFHLLNNSLPFLVGSVIILFFYRRIAVVSFVIIYLLTGLLVWFFGKPAYHIGLSGVVYGLISFIFWMGIFRRDLKSIGLALIVALLYSGMLYGVFPVQQGVSWESHLLGAIVGAFTSFVFRYRLEADDDPQEYIEEPHVERYFFDRDVFEKTKEERRRENDDPWTTNYS